ncbi:hypothetical protein CJF30_00007859 [Rutstroemia sp. NJR-2017a BBW]|nr:hypothetical protein CJF30_00007859 [Rutstroemia sp. NJR-2017a BBW]
MKLTEK